MATSLGPLTTTFSPPAGCLGTGIWQMPMPGRTDQYFLQGQPSAASCFPDNYDPHTTAFYVPGACPSDYTAVSNQEGQPYTNTEIITCCPRFAIFEARNTSQNVPFMSTMACQSRFGLSGVVSVTTSSGPFTSVIRATYTESDVLNAYGIIVVPATSTPTQSSNSRPSQAPSSATAQATSQPTSQVNSQVTSQAPSESPSQAPPQAPAHQGLSTAAKGGIGGGIAAFVLLALGGGWILFARRKRNRSQTTELYDEPPAYQDGARGFYGEADSKASELAVPKQMSELSARKEAHELPT